MSAFWSGVLVGACSFGAAWLAIGLVWLVAVLRELDEQRPLG